MQCTFFLRNNIFSPVTSAAIPYFATLSHKWYDVWKRVIEYKVSVLIFSTTFVLIISHSKNNSARDNNCTQVFI